MTQRPACSRTGVKLRRCDAAVELLYHEKVQASPDNAGEVLHNHQRLVWLDSHILQAAELEALSGATQVAKALEVLHADIQGVIEAQRPRSAA